MENTITYVQPLNERLRFFMRLGYLFKQADYSAQGDSIHDTHIGVNTLLDIMGMINQQDLKKEVIKELERINQTLTPLQSTPDIQHGRLQDILSSLERYKSELKGINGPIAQKLRDDEFLKNLNQRKNIPGGLTECDPPIYNHWLHQNPETRKTDLQNWLNCYGPLYKSIELIVDLIKQSTNGIQKTAENGVYQQTLDSNTPYKMVMVALPRETPYFAEISGGKHRFTVRFMDISSKPRPTQTSNTVVFDLYCCAL